jgi:hypothetical protein
MNLKTEAAQIVAYITSAVSAGIAVFVAFGPDLTDDQTAAILGATAVLAPIIAGLITRSQVYSQASVERISDQQYQAGLPPTDPQPPVPPPADVP